MVNMPPRRPTEFTNNQSALPDIQYGYASEILPHIQAALGGMLGSNETQQQSITPEEQAANNAIWSRLGQGKTASPQSVGPEVPMANKSTNTNYPPFENPFMAYQMPGMSAPQNFAQLTPLQQPQQPQPQQVAGLLGNGNEASMRSFLDNQLYGKQPAPQQLNSVGGSSTNQTNPFLYAQLYGRRGG